MEETEYRESEGTDSEVNQASEAQTHEGIAEQTVQVTPEAVPEGDENDSDELPDDPQKQREAFIKMRQQLKAYKEKEKEPVIEYNPEETAFMQDIRTAPSPLADADYSDPLLQAARNAEQRAKMVEARLEDMEAEAEFPQLREKSEGFDPLFHNRVQEKFLMELLKAQQTGKPRPTVAQVAKKVAAELNAGSTKASTMALEQAKQELTRKEQATFDARSSSANMQTPQDDSAARRRINRGDNDALAQALLDDELSGLPDSYFGIFR